MAYPSAEKLWEWLDKNVPSYPTPRSITLRNFEIDWSSLEGAFEVMLDDTVLPEKFKMSLEITGWMKFWMPMIHSPLGVPASYAAINLTPETSNAIEKGVKELLPRQLGVGLHPVTGEWVESLPIHLRIRDQAEFDRAKERIASPGFSISLQI